MIYESIVRPALDDKITKIFKRNKKLYKRLAKNMSEIVQNPQTYKPLRHDMKGLRRAHIDSFVITFSISENDKSVTFMDLDHHDKIYR